MSKKKDPKPEEPEQTEDAVNEEETEQVQEEPISIQKKEENKLPLPLKYYTKLDDLLQFLYPTHILHPNSTLRLFLYAEYGPLYNHHSYHQCLCNQCKTKCKSIRKENDIAKQLYYGKILIGTDECPLKLDANGNIENENETENKLNWLCDKCIHHCSTVFHLKSGPKNLHIVSDSELTKMEQEIKRKDILSIFVSRKEELENPLSVEEEEDLIQNQPFRVKHVPKLTKTQIINIFNKLPIYKLPVNIPEETSEQITTENEENQDENPENENEENPSKPDADKEQQQETNKEADTANNDESETNENAEEKQEIDDTETGDVVTEEEAEEVLSFYDISEVVRKVREIRRKDLLHRSITTQDPQKKGPKNRSKGIKTRALSYTKGKQKFAECEESNVLTRLLHTYTHEIATLKSASAGDVTQNVRLLRYLKNDNQTEWDSNCCLRNSNRLSKIKDIL